MNFLFLLEVKDLLDNQFYLFFIYLYSRSRGRRSRHAGTDHHQDTQRGGKTSGENFVHSGEIHYPKYDVYPSSQQTGKYTQPAECQTNYEEDCHYSSSGKYKNQRTDQDNHQSSYQRNKTWPKQNLVEDNQRVNYHNNKVEGPRYSSSSKKRGKPQQHHQHNLTRDEQPSECPSSHCPSGHDREHLVSTGESRNFLQQAEKSKASDPIPAIEEVGHYLEKAEARRAKSEKELVGKKMMKEKSKHEESDELLVQTDPDLPHQIPPPMEAQPQIHIQKELLLNNTLQTFRPQHPSHLQPNLTEHEPEGNQMQEQIQNDCCQIAVATHQSQDSAPIKKTSTSSRKKTDTIKSQAHQVSQIIHSCMIYIKSFKSSLPPLSATWPMWQIRLVDLNMSLEGSMSLWTEDPTMEGHLVTLVMLP